MRNHTKANSLFNIISVFLFSIAISSCAHAQTARNNGVQITIKVNRNKVAEGQSVVVSALAIRKDTLKPAADIYLFARVNGKTWGAKYRTLSSGVAHLLLPRPELGNNAITITDGVDTSRPVDVQVLPRHFNIITDPKHLIIMEYET